jgi:outer membrane protein TolC
MSICKKVVIIKIFILLHGCIIFSMMGCTVGPDFIRPPHPSVDRYTESQTPQVIRPGTGEADQHIHTGQEISSQWWELFQVRELNEILVDAIEMNRTIAAARATLDAAREAVSAVRGDISHR